MQKSQQLAAGDRAVVNTVLLLCIAVVLVGQATAGTTESDIWGHTAIGLDTVNAGRLLRVDPYSFTHDQRWVNHEWLWDVVSAAAYRSAGLTGLLALRAVLVGAVLWCVAKASRRAPIGVRGAALAAVALVCSAQWHATRPQLATLPLYAIVLANPSAWWLPALFVLWANVHGGWLIGLAFIGVQTIARPSPRQAALAAGCVLATLLTPYHIHLWTSLVDALSRGWDDVSEWAPVWSRAAGMAALWIWLAAVGLVAAVASRVAPSRSEWFWTIANFAAAARSRRLMGLAAVSAAIMLLPSWRQCAADSTPRWTPARRIVAALAIVCAGALAFSAVRPTLRCFPPAAGWGAPEPDAVAFFQNANVRGRVLVHFDFGEYAIFHLRERIKVSIDNRRETVYSDQVLQQHLAFYRGTNPDYPDRLQADAVWLPRTLDTVTRSLELRGWFKRFEGPKTVVLLRTPGPVVRGRISMDTPCFPNP